MCLECRVNLKYIESRETRRGGNLSSEAEEIKELGEVKCPNCEVLITVKKRTVYNQPNPRRKVIEELFTEESVQTTLDKPARRKKE
jgi:DNA-directed RNA polymerase subunit RPC12/RpoP